MIQKFCAYCGKKVEPQIIDLGGPCVCDNCVRQRFKEALDKRETKKSGCLFSLFSFLFR